jgi:hypothetical protein
MSDPVEVRAKLDEYAQELDRQSRELGQVEQTLGGANNVVGVETQYEKWIDDFEVGLWQAHQDGAKLPGVEMRGRLARKQMPPELLGNYVTLIAQRKRLEKRIGTLKVMVDAQRSILSALKSELEAVS